MILRVANFVVIGVLILAAAYVYRIKFDSTVQAERLAKIRSEVRHERDRIAALRAEWGQLDNPARIEALAKHFLKLAPIAPTQFDTFDSLPDRVSHDFTADGKDPIGGIIETLKDSNKDSNPVTGSIPAQLAAPAAQPNAAPMPADAHAASPTPNGTPAQ